MSRETYDDNCQGCQPALVDLKTRRPLGPDHPAMRAMMKIWTEATLEERRAFHNVCCNNSRSEEDLRLMAPLIERFKTDDALMEGRDR